MADNTDYQSYIKSDAKSVDQQVKDAIAELITAAGEQLSAAFDLDDYISDFSVPDWFISKAPNVPVPDGSLPSSFDGVDVPAFVFNPEDYLNSDLLTRYSYDSDFFDNFLESRLKDYIDSQGYFLVQSVQDALFEQTRQRDLQTLNDGLDAVDRFQARRGFPLPSSMHLAARNDVIKKYQDTYADRNKEITALIADKSLQEKMHAMDTSIKMEDIRSRFQLEYGKMYWQAADYLIRKYQADVQAEVSRVDANIKMMQLELEAEIKNSDVTRDQITTENDKQKLRLNAEISELQQQIDLWKQTYQARINAAAEAVKYYQSYTMGLLGSYNAIDYADKT